MAAEYLFVYGTLRRCSRHPLAQRLAKQAQWLGEARCAGSLFWIETYPGLVRDHAQAQAQWVVGDCYQLSGDGELLRQLDEYEGCGAQFAQPNEYRRVQTQVTLANQGKLAAWVYEYNGPVQGLERIPSGDFADESMRLPQL